MEDIWGRFKILQGGALLGDHGGEKYHLKIKMLCLFKTTDTSL